MAHFLRVVTITELAAFPNKKCTNAVIAALDQHSFPI